MSDQFRIPGDPNYNVENEGNPYNAKDTSISRGEPYTSDLAGRSTLVSDSVEMVKRLHAYLPWSSVKKGEVPTNNLGYSASTEENNVGSDYKSKYTN